MAFDASAPDINLDDIQAKTKDVSTRMGAAVKKGDVGSAFALGVEAMGDQSKGAQYEATETRKLMEDRMKARDAIPEPKVPDLKTYKAPEPTDPWALWGSPAMWMASMSGFLGRRSITNSLNAAAGYMNAVKANDEKTAKLKFDEWKVENENAIKAYEWEKDSYGRALGKLDANSEDAKAIIETQAHAMGNPEFAKFVGEHGVSASMEMFRQKEENARNLQTHSLEIQEQDLLTRMTAARKSGNPEQIKAIEQEIADFHKVHDKTLGGTELDRVSANLRAVDPSLSYEESISRAARIIHPVSSMAGQESAAVEEEMKVNGGDRAAAIKKVKEASRAPTAKAIEEANLKAWGEERGITNPAEAKLKWEAEKARLVAEARQSVPKNLTGNQLMIAKEKMTDYQIVKDLVQSAKEDVEDLGTNLLSQPEKAITNLAAQAGIGEARMQQLENKFVAIRSKVMNSSHLSAEYKASADTLSLNKPTIANIRALEWMLSNASAKAQGYDEAINESQSRMGGGNAPAGVDPGLWKHMTPAERALWTK